jgi:hypothetical protein
MQDSGITCRVCTLQWYVLMLLYSNRKFKLICPHDWVVPAYVEAAYKSIPITQADQSPGETS